MTDAAPAPPHNTNALLNANKLKLDLRHDGRAHAVLRDLHVCGGASSTSASIDGVTLSFVNFKAELPFFIERVLPLLRQAGLRQG
jgi:hypothetical protein